MARSMISLMSSNSHDGASIARCASPLDDISPTELISHSVLRILWAGGKSQSEATDCYPVNIQIFCEANWRDSLAQQQ